ncbi:MAG: phenylalanine--tRNA ligase subunit alpha, partial [Conexivisphaerales archaeon]
RKLGWITFEEGKLRLSETAISETSEEELLKLLSERPIQVESLTKDMLSAYESLSKRPGMIQLNEEKMQIVRLAKKPEKLQMEEELTLITPELIKEYAMVRAKQLDVKQIPKLAQIDVVSPVPLLNPGRMHPLTRLINEVRAVLVSMGFTEINGTLVQPSFWVFDALFTPQDHPARDMQDTLYIQNVKSTVKDVKLIKRVKGTHENGWKTGSLGWRYQWSEEEAKRSVLRTHTTALSCRYLAENPLKESRVFSIGRVFRNESLDSTHLFEFTQIEAVISERNSTARTLLGYMTQFYRGLGFHDVKFNPTYFPYTEPSFEPLVYSEELERWIELGGSGVFRPEVVQPLGVRNNVLAWGFGLERIAMVRYAIEDIRTIYGNDLAWLRGVREYP